VQRLARSQRVFLKLKAAVSEIRVTETEPERIQNSAVPVAVCSSVSHVVVLKIRKVGGRLVKRDGQAAGGIRLSGQDVRKRASCFFTGIPSVQNRIGQIRRERQCASAE